MSCCNIPDVSVDACYPSVNSRVKELIPMPYDINEMKMLKGIAKQYTIESIEVVHINENVEENMMMPHIFIHTTQAVIVTYHNFEGKQFKFNYEV